MAMVEVTFPSGGQGKLLKWRVAVGTMVSAGRVLLLYHSITPGSDGNRGPEKKFRATRYGRVTEMLAKEGDILQSGQVILRLEGCKHPTVMKDLCAECGADLRVEEIGKDGEKGTMSQASVPMVHSVPELKVCPELAEKIGKEDEQRLLQDRKLVLLVDLDQTIVHTTNDIVPTDMKDVYHYQLYGPHSPWYHTRLRPSTRHFLSEMSKLYELHICTFGARNYAHTVAALLDKDGVLFSHRILSRDECFDPASKTANLKALFPCGDDMVCIIDDREDVWQGCGNLIQVKPYHFFRHTGDIHAPPGLEKYDLPSLPESSNPDERDTQEIQCENNKNGMTNETYDENINVNKGLNVDQKENSERKKESENNEVDFDKGSGNVEDVGKTKEVTLNEQKENMKIKKQQEENDILRTKAKMEDEDIDDYLLYLEDILRRIHAEFYDNIGETGRRSLKEIIPRVRAQVLKGLRLTFSGLIPTHQKLHESRAYKVARALGAEITQDLTEGTTHLVAIKPGTAKVNTAKKTGNIKIVNPDWLWTCAERWERVDERLFPLTIKTRGSRIPPPHCSSPECVENETKETSDRFADSINPLMSFTQEEIDNMDKEVEEDMNDQEMDTSVIDAEDVNRKRQHNSSSESLESMNDYQLEIVKKRRKISNNSSTEGNSCFNKIKEGNNDGNNGDGDDNDKFIFNFDDDNDTDIQLNNDNNDDEEEEEDEEDPEIRFRKGLPADLDLGDNSQESDDEEEQDNEDDGEWNAMGAALEREFLSD